ncbi:MAG: glycolate oxidase subunit GlcE [Gammaproteobacteria bacterium]|nr:glycolate oxidase subunit GlcE [Gammaproteobacteria bacterium]
MNQDISEQLQQQVLNAAKSSQPLQIKGSGSKIFLGHVADVSILDVSAHRGIVSYDPVELVITARAGTPLRELEQTLSEANQMLPFEPPHFGLNATLGGTIACGLSGPARSFSGSARDYVLGVKMINGRGEILNFGGQVMKNVAGYDCSRLMAGAMGTLGVILAVSLKVLPKQAAEITLINKISLSQALDTMNHWSGQSLPLSAACYEGEHCYLRLSGAKTAVENAQELIGGELHADSHDFWQTIKEHQHPFFQSDRPLWRLSLPAERPAIDIPGEWLIDWCGAQRWLLSDSCAEVIREQALQAGGHATLFRRGATNTEVFQLPTDGVMQLHRRLKQAFDPAGIFNPGRLYPGL